MPADERIEARPGARVGGMLLAAGESRRMGVNKLLLRLDGEAVVHRAARLAFEGGLAPVLVVLGHQADDVRAALEVLPCETVINSDYARGQATSLRCGAAALGDGLEAVAVLLADMPAVSAEMIAALVGEYRRSGARLVISDYAGVTAPPMLYDRSLFAELRTAEDGRCGRQIAKRHRADATVLHWPAEALADLDVPADYERLQAASTARS